MRAGEYLVDIWSTSGGIDTVVTKYRLCLKALRFNFLKRLLHLKAGGKTKVAVRKWPSKQNSKVAIGF